VGAKKFDMEMLAKKKLSRKFGDGVKLAFDLTILKPAEYIAEASK